MRRLGFFLAAFALSLGFSAGPSSVFVIHATSGSLTPSNSSGKDPEYTLLFNDVSNMISMGKASSETGQTIAIADFLTAWQKNSRAINETPVHGALRGTHGGQPFASNVNVVQLTYTANKKQLVLVVTFLNYMAKQPAMKPLFALDHPMLIISENALPPEMVSALTNPSKAKGSGSSQNQSPGEIVQ